ncbi:NitT/TauT family transport system substrate-binding protein [Granulicella rosea]|uniref:NitT/TauT family transport system substrate-binding protein n=1 Tax=Granulicella rosea TaxID=474952 RepID=A0A239M8G2_9BACT|nr:ABC transporter substrate-binding protein [Granulicella rosea]SNT38344.1 NitT/TauT family transport system substrate-binding protein [Granulicella rosea]
MRLQRAFVFSLCLLPFLLTACKRQAAPGGLTQVKLQADWYPQPEHGGFYTALVKGYYKDEGLDVQIIPGGPFVTSESLVASGAVQFGMNSSDHVLESIANSGEPLVAVGATMQHDPQGIMVRDSSPVHAWADLEGHTVSVKPGSTWWEFIVKKFNLTHVRETPATYSVANFLQDPNYIQQAFVTSEPYFASKAGVQTRMLLNSAAGYDPYRVFYTSQSYAKEHPDVVAKFTRASIRGWKEYLADPAPANAAILKQNPALNPDWMNFSYNALKKGHFIDGPDGTQTGRFDPARWNALYKQLLDLKVLKQPIDPAQAYTTQYQK